MLKRSEKVFNVVGGVVVGVGDDDVVDDIAGDIGVCGGDVAFCSYDAVFNVEYTDKMYW